MSAIHLRCKIFPGAFLLYFCKPRYSINGSPEQICRWGENPIALQPGRYHLRVWYRYITGPTNVGELVLDVPDGQAVRVVYKTRWNVFLAGKLEITGAGYAGAPSAGPGAGPMPYAHGQAATPQGAHATQAHQPGWHADPTGRHEQRWWDGHQWSPGVADRGVTANDPL